MKKNLRYHLINKVSNNFFESVYGFKNPELVCRTMRKSSTTKFDNFEIKVCVLI